VLVAALLTAGITGLGAQGLLEPLCTELAYARGWPCFALWLAAAWLAMPSRVVGTGFVRTLVHAIAWISVVLWWCMAIGLADLWNRADLLWHAYAIVGVGLAVWRLWLAQLLLRRAVRSALRAGPRPVGLLRLVGGEPRELDRTVGLADRVLGWVARVKFGDGVGRFRRWCFGVDGTSQVVLDEVMRQTDLASLWARRALGRKAEERHAFYCVGDPSAELNALALRFAFEVDVWIAVRRACPEGVSGSAIRHRSVAVYASMALGRARDRHAGQEEFRNAYRRLSEVGVADPETCAILEFADAVELAGTPQLLRKVTANRISSDAEMLIHGLAVAAAFTALRQPRPARYVLALTEARIGAAAVDQEGKEASVEVRKHRLRTTRAMLSEVAQRCIVVAQQQGSEGESPFVAAATDGAENSLGRWRTNAIDHAKLGRHPITGESVRVADHGLLPRPVRRREVGLGLGAALILAAACIWMIVPAGAPFIGRTHDWYDVPLGGAFSARPGAGVAVADPEGLPSFLLADPKSGLAVLHVDSLRAGREGGPGTALDGLVQRLVVNSDGTTLALFDAASNGSACLSLRDRSGNWLPILGASEVPLDGSDVEAVLPGPTDPLVLRKSGTERLLRYDQRRRTLVPAESSGSTILEGRLLDFCEYGDGGGPSGLWLLTDGGASGRPRIYRVGATGGLGGLAVQAVGGPPLSARQPVALAAFGSTSVAILDSSGGVWALESDASSWRRLLAGDQNLRLDGVALAVVQPGEPRLWFVRGNDVWTRSLAVGASGPGSAEGWALRELPAAAVAALAGRAMLVASSVHGGSICLVAPGNERGALVRLLVAKTVGAPLRDGDAADLIAFEELLAADERLLDADWVDERCVLTIESRASGGATLLDELRLDGASSPRRNLRTAPKPEAAVLRSEPVSIEGGPYLALDRGLRGALATLRDGSVIRLQPDQDMLMPVDEGGRQWVGSVKVPADALDAAVSVRGSREELQILARSGAVSGSLVVGGSAASNSILVDTSQRPPFPAIAEASVVVANGSGALFVGPETLWQFDAAAAAKHFVDRSSELGERPAVFALTMADGRPAVVWVAEGGQEVRLLLDGKVSSAKLDRPLTKLVPGFGEVVAFGLDSAGTISSFDARLQATVLVASQSAGPKAILGAALRDGYVDYLDADGLHSFDRQSGGWSMVGLQGAHRIHSLPDAGSTTLVLPAARGLPKVLDPRLAPDRLRALDALGELERPMVLGNGVLGTVAEDAALGWLAANGATRSSVANRTVDGLDMSVVVQAGKDGDALVLRGGTASGAEPDLLVRYPIAEGKIHSFRAPGLRTATLGADGWYVLSDKGVTRLARADLRPVASWKLRLGDRAMLSADAAGPSAVADVQGVALLTDAEPNWLLKAPEGRSAASVSAAVAWSNRILAIVEGRAWLRTADPTDPFAPLASIGRRVDFAALDPDGKPWLRADGLWAAVADGKSVGPSLAWDVDRRQVNVRGGVPMVGDRTLRGFGAVAAEVGDLRGVESLDGGDWILFGTGGAVRFDPRTREFAAVPESWNSRVRVYDRAKGSPVLLDERSVAFDAERATDTPWFGGQAVAELLVDAQPLALLSDGTVCDLAGQAIAGLPPAAAGKSVAVVAVAAVADGIYRLRADRSIDRLRADNFVAATLTQLGDAIGALGDRILVHDRSQREVRSADGRLRIAAADWFVAADGIALRGPDGRLGVLRESAPEWLSSPQPLPGMLLGSLAGSSVGLVRSPNGQYSLFDLLAGCEVESEIDLHAPVLSGNRVYQVAKDGCRIEAIDARGQLLASRTFKSVALMGSSSAVQLTALRNEPGTQKVVSLNFKDFAPQENIWEIPDVQTAIIGTASEVVRIAELPGGARLLLTSQVIGLDFVGHLRVWANPLQTSDVSLDLRGSCLVAMQSGMEPVPLLRQSEFGWLRVPLVGRRPEAWSWSVVLGDAAMQPIELRSAEDQVRLSAGILRTGDGTLRQREISSLAVQGDHLIVQYRDGQSETIQRVAATVPQQLVEPLREVGGELFFDVGKEAICLGRPIVGSLMPCHLVKGFAVADGRGLVWFDAVGQLWTADGAGRRLLRAGMGDGEFGVDDQGLTCAKGSDGTVLRLRIVGRQVQAEPASAVLVYSASSHRPGRIGNLQWMPVAGGSTGFAWSLIEASGAEYPLQATESGFAELSAPRLATRDGSPSLELGGEGRWLAVPIRNRTVAWAELRRVDARLRSPTDRPLRTVAATDGVDLHIDAAATRLRLASTEFLFDTATRTFACNRCEGIAVDGNRYVTLCSNGELLAWSDLRDGILIAPVRMGPPAAGRPCALWSDGSQCIAEVRAVGGAVTHWRLAGTQWLSYRQDAFLAAPGAEWSWKAATGFRWDGEDYLPLADGWPALACEVPAQDPADQDASLRVEGTSSVTYRAVDGRWYKLLPGKLPNAVAAPDPLPATIEFGRLAVRRHAGAAGASSAATLRSVDDASRLEFTLRLVDGLVPDLEDWSPASELRRGDAITVYRTTLRSGILRPYRVVDGVLQSLPPVLMALPPNYDHGGPLRSANGLQLGFDHRLTVRGLDLGVPTPSGFALCRPEAMLPIALTGAFGLDVVASGGRFRWQPGNVLHSVECIDDKLQATGVEWVARNGAMECLLVNPRGERLRLEAVDRPLTAAEAPKPGPKLVADLGAAGAMTLMPSRNADRGITLSREGSNPTTLYLMQAADGSATMAHWQAETIETTAEGLRTRSDRWVANYVLGESSATLTSVVPAGSVPETSVVALGGGLYSHRSIAGGRTLCTEAIPGAPPWPLRSMTSFGRAYAYGTDEVLEAHAAWGRVWDAQGKVARRLRADQVSPLGGANAYRVDDRIVADGGLYRLSDGPIPTRVGEADTASPLAFLAEQRHGPWTVSHSARGQDLRVLLHGSAAGASGALFVDHAVAVVSYGAQLAVVDRAGARNLASTDWRPHTESAAADLSTASSQRCVGVEVGTEIARALVSTAGETWVMPSGTQGLTAANPVVVYTSWARDKALDVRLAGDGTAHLRRRSSGASDWVDYPPIERAMVWVDGRFAFDAPIDAYLAKPDGGEASGCVQMRLGFEWPSRPSADRSSAITLVEPTRLPDPYGPDLHPAWLSGTGLGLGDLESVRAPLGTPLLCYRHEDRLFAIGESGCRWVELGPRWQGRGVR
jgi:hypothetical protein